MSEHDVVHNSHFRSSLRSQTRGRELARVAAGAASYHITRVRGLLLKKIDLPKISTLYVLS